jgi:hypothetical protein
MRKMTGFIVGFLIANVVNLYKTNYKTTNLICDDTCLELFNFVTEELCFSVCEEL